MLKFMAAVRRLEHVSHDELVHAWNTFTLRMSFRWSSRNAIASPSLTRLGQRRCGQPSTGRYGRAVFRDREHFETTIGRQAPPNIDADKFSTYAAIQPGCNLFCDRASQR